MDLSSVVRRHWLVAVGCVFYHSLYFLLRRYVVRGVCDPVLSRRPHNGHSETATHHESDRNHRLVNGFTPGNARGVGSKHGVGESVEVKRSKLTDGEVADIAAKVVSIVAATFIAGEGLSTMRQTADDIMRSKSSTLAPASDFFVWYFVADVFHMYNTVYLRCNLGKERSPRRRLWIFARKKGLLIAHHAFLIIVAYPLGFDRSWRKELGDFLIGTLFIRELSTPLLMLAQILKTLDLHRTAMATVNGALTILTFFIFRVMNTPLTVLLYAAQNHDWDVLAAMWTMRPVCHVTLALEFVLQVYWFSGLIRIAGSTVAARNWDWGKIRSE